MIFTQGLKIDLTANYGVKIKCGQKRLGSKKFKRKGSLSGEEGD